MRGGVIDVFVPLYRFPLRIELFGDLVESIRFFDPETQRTMRAVDEIYVHPVRETVRTRGNRLRDRMLEAGDLAEHPSSKTRAMLDQIEKGEDFFGVEALTPAFHERMASIGEYLPRRRAPVRRRARGVHRGARRRARRGRRVVPGAPRRAPAGLSARGLLPVDRRSCARSSIAARASRRISSRSPATARSRSVRFAVEQHRDLAIELQRARAEKHEELLRPLAGRLRDWRDEGVRTLIAVPNLQHAERLESLLKGYGIVPHLHRVPCRRTISSMQARSG